MEKNELSKISEYGERGKHAKDIPGKGIGLFVIKKSLILMGMEPMFIAPTYQNDFSIDDVVYNENHFKFVF
jgi:hypothetical protein